MPHRVDPRGTLGCSGHHAALMSGLPITQAPPKRTIRSVIFEQFSVQTGLGMVGKMILRDTEMRGKWWWESRVHCGVAPECRGQALKGKVGPGPPGLLTTGPLREQNGDTW